MLRHRTSSDVETVALLVLKALGAEDRTLPEYAGEVGRNAGARRVDDESAWVLVRLEGPYVIGVCHGAPEWDFERREPVPGGAHLTGLFVDPGHWGHGHGRALLRAAAEHVQTRGFQTVRLWVAVDNTRAIRLYRAEGWQATGRHATASDGKDLAEYETELASRQSSSQKAYPVLWGGL